MLICQKQIYCSCSRNKPSIGNHIAQSKTPPGAFAGRTAGELPGFCSFWHPQSFSDFGVESLRCRLCFGGSGVGLRLCISNQRQGMLIPLAQDTLCVVVGRGCLLWDSCSLHCHCSPETAVCLCPCRGLDSTTSKLSKRLFGGLFFLKPGRIKSNHPLLKKLPWSSNQCQQAFIGYLQC